MERDTGEDLGLGIVIGFAITLAAFVSVTIYIGTESKSVECNVVEVSSILDTAVVSCSQNYTTTGGNLMEGDIITRDLSELTIID